ncbi:hypothetical protein ACHAXA_009408 [Cyclostephanos tholiformis]|uniref:Coenzyme Q-binding protein COQ10 START domain-containing protein n=1 Tax=Cyclostephanos tholiformis TaxID=382380 RepID=A0ABD3RAE4_9STRA
MIYSFGQKKFTHINHDGRTRNLFVIPRALRSSLLLLYAVLSPSLSANAFAPPSRILTRRCPLGANFFGRSRTLSFASNSHLVVSIQNEVNGNINRRRNSTGKRLSEKIKSTSNAYSQYYKEGVLVGIERTSTNSRRISGEIIMDLPISAIWNILTDYDNLSVHVPNLTKSSVINVNGVKSGERPRVYQRGAQRIFGFEFGADVTLDMTENIHHSNCYSVDFECVDSQFFSQFDGSWILEEYSKSRTMVRYIVDVRPKGPVPVAALEWRIKEDVPINILAVSKSAQAIAAKDYLFPAEQEPLVLISDSQLAQQKLRESLTQQPITFPLQQQTRHLDATFNLLKRTAKAFLPSPVITKAKQAMAAGEIIWQVRTPAKQVAAPATSHFSISLSQSQINGIDNFDVDWYLDETMAMYLDD